MKRTAKTVIIQNTILQIEAPVFLDEDNTEYAKINNTYCAINTLLYAGYEILK